jgi:predicted membrane protein
MNGLNKTIVNPENIKGIFPLLSVFLIVVEGLLGYWLFRAESMNERVIVGLLMTVIFIFFLFVALKVKQTEDNKSNSSDEVLRISAERTDEIALVKDKLIKDLMKESEGFKDELAKLKPEYDKLKLQYAKLNRIHDIIMPELDDKIKVKLIDKGILD